MHTSLHSYGRKSLTPKTKKLIPFVDVTAMVNLSFLLILFFMLQSFIQKPQALDLELPDKNSVTCGGSNIISCIEGWRTITIILGKNNEVITYQGQINDPIEFPKRFKLDSESFKTYLLQKRNEFCSRVNNPIKEKLFINLKPSDYSKYSDLVTTIDLINTVIQTNYSINELNKLENKMVVQNAKTSL